MEEEILSPAPVEESPPVPAPAEIPAEIRRHLQSLEEQAAALDLDLRRELADPTFARLTAPGGVSVADAYYALHRRELQQAAMEAAARGVARSVRAGVRRPVEEAGHAPGIPRFDYRRADKQQRQALKSAIRTAAARGEKIYPGREF